MEIVNFLDRMVESIQEACHSLVVVFNRLCALLEELQLLEEITAIVCRHKTSSHDLLHLIPSRDGWIAFLAVSLDDLLPPNENIVSELKGCHGDLLFLFIIVKTEYLVDLKCP